ncbi:MAG: hypothetical protein ACBR12_17110 [Microcoleus sp.]
MKSRHRLDAIALWATIIYLSQKGCQGLAGCLILLLTEIMGDV